MININLIAERRAKKVREMTIVRVSGLVIVLVFIFMLVMNGFAYLALRNSQIQAEDISQQLKAKQQQYAELLKIEDQINVIEPKVRLIKQVRVSEAAWMIILRDVSRVIPDTVVLDNLTAVATDKGVTLRINGKARDQDAVAVFMENLRQQTAWADLPSSGAINSIQTGDTPGVTFDLSVPIRELVGGGL